MRQLFDFACSTMARFPKSTRTSISPKVAPLVFFYFNVQKYLVGTEDPRQSVCCKRFGKLTAMAGRILTVGLIGIHPIEG